MGPFELLIETRSGNLPAWVLTECVPCSLEEALKPGDIVKDRQTRAVGTVLAVTGGNVGVVWDKSGSLAPVVPERNLQKLGIFRRGFERLKGDFEDALQAVGMVGSDMYDAVATM